MKKVEFDYLDFNAYVKLRARYDAMNALQYDEDTADLDNEIELDEIKLELKQYELNLSKPLRPFSTMPIKGILSRF